MEGIINIDKSKYLDEAKEIVKNVFKETQMSDLLLEQLTIDIMDTSLEWGGDFSPSSIEGIAKQYKRSDSLSRIKQRIGE